jgi:hypothetical protein
MSNNYTRKTGKTDEEMAKMMDDETWFTAQEAFDAGFVDESIVLALWIINMPLSDILTTSAIIAMAVAIDAAIPSICAVICAFVLSSADIIAQPAVDFLWKVDKVMSNNYTRKTGKTDDEMAKMMDDETWFTAQEAFDAGYFYI